MLGNERKLIKTYWLHITVLVIFILISFAFFSIIENREIPDLKINEMGNTVQKDVENGPDWDNDTSSGNVLPQTLFTSGDKSLLNACDERELVIMLKFKISGIDGNNSRHFLIHRYTNNQFPYTGWAVAIRLGKGVFRPQFYYRNHRGDGGWFSLKEIYFNDGENYNLMIGVNPGKYAVGYLIIDNANLENPNRKVEFLGGIDLDGINVINIGSELIVNRVTSSKESVGTEIKSFLIGCSEFTEKPKQYITEKLMAIGPPEKAINIDKIIFSGKTD